ncbi:Chromosome partition protein Smc [Enterobacter cloacae]|nr:Chromosome partition protein Smc [Enterobacter cloacae]CAE7477655.1 Chromosome partition protein Smc [Enterobacter cloacae]CAE7506108.1 Chromosome partition protein Smc [Enterobacter cloacae]CAH3658083.1 Chromosome partition protein Smc [Enterobacter cloacae]CAH3660173.1 Chromosome partition protein Smc [Enterobacter cloacae]
MAGEKNAGSIVYEISADVEPLLQGGKQAIDALDKLDAAARQSGKGMDNLDQSASQTGSAFTELAGYANSMDSQLRKLNTSVSGIARAMEEARTGTGSTTSEFNRANAVIEALGNQVAILEEAQVNGARSAAVFASQLRAGANATEEEKRTIAELAGAFYDMKASSDAAAKSAASVAAATQRAESSISGLEKEVSILNTEMQAGSRSAAILAAQLSAGEGASDAQKAKIAQLAGALFDMREAQKSASAASAEAAKQLAQQANEANRISGITSDLSNQIAILSEQQTNGARSAAILAAQLRAGASATDADKQKIGELTGQLFDMKRTTDVAAGGNKGWKTSMQQAGYQVQDFIVQVQGGQSALVAFSQQGSQLAGAFGPGGAVVGAIIALGSVLAGVLITSLNGGKNAMDALKDAAEAMDKVITISSQGVAALSDKYAALARVNADVATLLRNQALLEYNQAISKIPKAISDASDAFITLGDRALAAVGGASPSIKKFNDELSALGVTTTDWSQAIQQANSQGQYASGIVNSLSSTVSTLSSRLGISKQSAFDLARELSDLSNNPSPEALQELAKKLQEMKSSSKDGQSAIAELAGKLVDLAREAANAKINVDSLNKSTDNLTAGQKNLIKQSERNLALSKLQGEARARLQAQYAAEDAGFAKDDPHAKQMEDDAAATYKNTQVQKSLQSEQKKGASQADSIAQKLANLKQQSELAADSTNKLSREQAILAAQQSLGKGATKEQIALAGQYAAKKWDTANAIKAEAAAQKLLPEAAENASYKQDVEDLNTALAAKKISQEQYNQTSERLAATHQANLAKIQAQQAVTPQQEAVGGVDPVQQLANENAKKLALIQSYEQQGLITHQNAMALRAATDTQYEQARIAAQWEIFRNQSMGNELLAASFDSLAGNASNALTGIITGSMSAQEAMQSLASNALNSLINGFVQMGVDWVKSAVMGAAAQTSAIATTTAAQTAGLATTTAASTAAATTTMAVWTPAAAVASIGSFGGAAAIGIAALIAAMAMAGGIAGKRKNGGPVSAGRTYQVGEGGMPEIYQASNGSQYMIPGDNGKVISNKDMQGGSGVIINNIVQNYTSATVDSQGTVNSDGSITLTTIIADLNNGGPISQGITSNFNVKRTPNGQG